MKSSSNRKHARKFVTKFKEQDSPADLTSFCEIIAASMLEGLAKDEKRSVNH